MKLLDLINEEPHVISDKERIRARKVYKAFQTGVYRPYPDVNKLKYVLPDFQDHQIYNLSNDDKVMMFTDLSQIKMYMISSAGNDVEVRAEGDDTAIVRNITNKIKSKFLNYNIIMVIDSL